MGTSAFLYPYLFYLDDNNGFMLICSQSNKIHAFDVG